MIEADQIPPEVVEAGAIADFEAWREWHGKSDVWDDLGLEEKNAYRDAARAVCLAMLNAWPGMINGNYFAEPSIILPLEDKEGRT